MKIIVDTNIIFSAVLNSSSRIGKILINSNKYFDLYTCNFLKTEILKNQEKIQSLTGLSETETDELVLLVTKNIKFINEKLISIETLSITEKLLKDIDPGDIPFVALAKQLKCKLWTGDKKLIKGLKIKGFTDTITTAELSNLLNNLEVKL